MQSMNDFKIPNGNYDTVFALRSIRSILEDRERELLEVKGPCSNQSCRLHFAHSGPCDCRIGIKDFGDLIELIYDEIYPGDIFLSEDRLEVAERIAGALDAARVIDRAVYP